MLDEETADEMERLSAALAAKDAEIERLKGVIRGDYEKTTKYALDQAVAHGHRLQAENKRLREALAEFVGQDATDARRLRHAIVEARRHLAKGRALWNGPCIQCDGVLEQALTVNNDAADIARAALKEGHDAPPEGGTDG